MKLACRPDWPVLTHYDQDHLTRLALPLGGIGTGTISLGGRGDLRDWEVMNRPAKGFRPREALFALYCKPAGGEAVTRCLEGTLQPPFEGASGATEANHGWPRFRHAEFHAAYPFGQLLLSDPEVPLQVRLEAFNPLVAADLPSSSIPVAILRYVLLNPTDQDVSAAVCGSFRNFIGHDGGRGEAKGSVNDWRDGDGPVRGVFLRSEGVPETSEQWGTMALTTTARTGLSYRTAWSKLSWGDTLLDFWDDFSDDGQLEDRDGGGVDDPHASLAVKLRVPARSEKEVTFLIAWHFPNRLGWKPDDPVKDRVGNHYTTVYTDAWDVACRTAAQLDDLEQRSAEFVQAFLAADLPEVVKEAALYNVSTLRTQTCFRTADGRFYGWEGCHDKAGCCPGSCTHVWNYEQATAFLFGELARTMREVEFAQATDERGQMSFRVGLPLDPRRRESKLAAADGQMGCLLKLYRDWQLSGDDELLRSLWPHAKRALEFCWLPGGWDGDQDGVMEGCQHNTMDVEYYGPNPQMTGWYLGALRAAEEMARHLGETDFADRCRTLFEQGRAWVDEHLFNGEYYEHEIRPPGDALVADGLRSQMGAKNLQEPELQLGAGCLVDQLVGQFLAHVCGLGYLLDPDHVRTTLEAIYRHNYREELSGHFNHLRSFALADESALLMASYPKGRRPTRPFPYYNEVMTGFEYTAAVHLLYEGQLEAGLKCIASIRARYDGRRRSPFDEAECGHHYARAMASWAAVLALTGFHYSGVEQHLTFAAPSASTTLFWSTGDAWGTGILKPTRKGAKLSLTAGGGTLKLQRVTLTGLGTLELTKPKELAAPRSATFEIKA